MENLNLYEILNLTDKSSVEEVKKSYKKLVKTHHPDKGGNPETFKKIQLAYEILSNEEKKERYDRFGMKAFLNGNDNHDNDFDIGNIFEQMGMFGNRNPFENIFGNIFGNNNQQSRHKQKCSNVSVNLEIN